MKLNYFTTQTLPKGEHHKNAVPKIGFGKNGAIRFNAQACSLIGINDGDRISIAQDEEDPANWYVFKDDSHGFVCRIMSDKKSHGFNHATLINTFKDAMGIDSRKGFSFLMAGIPTTMKGDKTKYWGILIPS